MSQHISTEICKKNQIWAEIMGRIWPNFTINKAPHLPDLLCLRKMESWKSKVSMESSNQKTQFLQASATWNFGRVLFYSIFVNTRSYTPDWFFRGVCKKIYRSLILNMIQRIFSSSYTLNHAQESFYGNFLHLKVFEVNLKLCCFNSFLGPGTNQNWSRDSIDVWIAMLWKDMELEFEENLSQNIV